MERQRGRAVFLFSYDLKDNKDEQRRIFDGNEFRTSGAWYWKIVHQHFSDWLLGRSDVFERKNDEIWRVSVRADSRWCKVIVCHQNSGMKKLRVWRQCVLKQDAKEDNVFWNGTSIEFLQVQGRCNMVKTFLTKGQSGCVVLYFL